MFAIGTQDKNGSLQYHLGSVGQTQIGNLIFEVKQLAPKYFRLAIHNTGKPIKEGLNPATVNWANPETVLINAAYLIIPSNLNLKWQNELRCQLLSDNGQFKFFQIMSPAERHAQSPFIPGSDTQHALEGGTSVFWEAYEGSPVYAHNVPPQKLDLAKQYLRVIDGYSSTKWPLVSKLKELFSVRPTSLALNPTITPTTPIQDIGYYHENFNHHLGGNRDNRGHYFFKALYFDGDSNYHYDSPLYCLEYFLKSGDEAAFELGLEFVKRKWAYGWYKTSGIDSRVSYASKGEKTTYRLGDYLSAQPEKTWHESTVCYAHITGDPDLLALSQKIGDHLLGLTNDYVWNRAWGSRKIGWFLKNLKVHYFWTQNPAFKSKAESFINSTMSKVKNFGGVDEMWFANVGNGVQSEHSPWMDGKAFGAILEWIHEYGICQQHKPKLEQMLEYSCTHDTYDVGPYKAIKYNVWRPYVGVDMNAPILAAHGIGANNATFMWGLFMAHKVFPQNTIIKNTLGLMADLTFKSIGNTFSLMLQNGPMQPWQLGFYMGGTYGSASMKIHLAYQIACRDEWIKVAEQL